MLEYQALQTSLISTSCTFEAKKDFWNYLSFLMDSPGKLEISTYVWGALCFRSCRD